VDRLLERLQSAGAALAVTAGIAGFLASIGLRQIPALDAGTVRLLGGLLALVGLAGGWATARRAQAIDRVRFEVVADLALTSGEREYAHKEAERERRAAGIVFLALPVALAYWLSYHVTPEIKAMAFPTLTIPPLVGYVVGLGAAHLAARRAGEPPP
jgi:hypothetical protein